MQLVWSLIVAWCMVASAAPHGPNDRSRTHAGVSMSPRFHHPVRHREFRPNLAPFVAPERTALPLPPRAVFVVATPVELTSARDRVTTLVARGPP